MKNIQGSGRIWLDKHHVFSQSSKFLSATIYLLSKWGCCFLQRLLHPLGVLPPPSLFPHTKQTLENITCAVHRCVLLPDPAYKSSDLEFHVFHPFL